LAAPPLTDDSRPLPAFCSPPLTELPVAIAWLPEPPPTAAKLLGYPP
jgi:hypothetical protein